ncbi:MAG: histidine kinase [Bifidobacteriaceae bacterium]|nr:histidine kinase [Bifidobacteriaceae bacterium]
MSETQTDHPADTAGVSAAVQADAGTMAAVSGPLRPGPPGPALPQPGPFRRFAAGHPVLMDLAVAALYLVQVVALANPPRRAALVPSGPRARLDPLVASLPERAIAFYLLGSVIAGAIVLLAWRRRHPLWLLAAAMAIDFLDWAMTGGSDSWLPLFALFAVGQRTSPRAAWIGLAAACAEAELSGSLFGGRGPAAPESIAGMAIYVMVVSVSVHLGNRRRYVAALIDRAEHLALERDQRAQIAVAAERERIAREMHDVVAHSVVVMVTLSDGAQAAVGRDPDQARQAMALVSETGRGAVADMRWLLSVLRAEPDLAPQPGLGQLLGLIDSFRAAGLPVELSLAAAVPPDQALELALYRIVQESLTNVLRHAGGTRWVHVDITEEAPFLYRVVIANGPPEGAPAEGGSWEGSGQGLVGMKQRAILFDGEFMAGPAPDGGWIVEATLRKERSR